jgi:hypothetical protein
MCTGIETETLREKFGVKGQGFGEGIEFNFTLKT